MSPSVFLLVGDPFLIEEKVRFLVAQIGKQTSGEVPLQIRYLGETPLATLLAEARTLPFLAAAQVFRLKGADTLKKKDWEAIEAYLSRPADKTHLLFEAESLSSDGLEKVIAAKGEIFFFEGRDKRSAVSHFIQEKLKHLGKAMTREARSRLEEMAGEAPAFLDTLLEQIITYAGDQPTITEEMVERFEEKWGEVNVFKLTDALANRQPDIALKILAELFQGGDRDAVSLIGLLHWQIRRLWQARVLMEDTPGVGSPEAGEAAVLKRCRVSPFQSPFFLRQLRGLDRKKLERALEGLFHLDWRLKTGRAEMPVALERWVAELTT